MNINLLNRIEKSVSYNFHSFKPFQNALSSELTTDRYIVGS